MKFEKGIYKTNLITSADTSFTVEVITSTEKTVTYLHPLTHAQARTKIHTFNGKDFFFPLGRHSMAPTIYHEDMGVA